jgi:F420-dependent oxidoreductase-like protein
VKLGIMIEGQEGLNWESWQRIARAVEDLGFESLWRSDHFFSFSNPRERDSLETWVSLGFLATETKRIRFGPMVCAMTFRHPSMLARMAAGVDALSGGRLELGVGAGWNAVEHEAFGVPFPPLRTRMDLLDEGLEVIRRLWTESPANYAGRHFQLKDATLLPKPAQQPRPPLIVGGNGERRTLRAVARYADEWNATSIAPEGYRAKVAALERHCAAAGRDPATIRRSYMAGFVIGRDAGELRKRLAGVGSAFPPLASGPPDQVLPAIRARGWFVGSPAEVVAQLRGLAALGVERALLQHLDLGNFDVLEQIAREILPNV